MPRGVQTSHAPTRLEADGLGFPVYGKKYTYKHSDLVSNVIAFPIPAGKLVLGVMHRVTTAFAGGSPSTTLGDSAAADRWASLNGASPDDISPTSLNDVFLSLAKGGIQPKFYAASDRLIVTHQAGLTAGEAEVTIFFDGKEV